MRRLRPTLLEQIEGLPAHYYAQPVTPLPLSDRLAHADQFVITTGAAIHLGGNQAYYSPVGDHIQLPPFEAFKDKESYYATALHELTHNAASRIMPRRTWNSTELGAIRRGCSA